MVGQLRIRAPVLSGEKHGSRSDAVLAIRSLSSLCLRCVLDVFIYDRTKGKEKKYLYWRWFSY